MDVADLIAEFGAYYINSGQNYANLVRQLRHKAITDELFTTISTDDTEYRMAETGIGRLLQPFQKAFTPIGNVQLVPVAIKSFKMKMDHTEYPDDIEASWAGFLSDNNLNRKEWPLIKWLVEVELLPQIKEDYELNEVYKGVFAAPSNGTAGAVSTAMNGLKKIINDHVTNGRITPIATGALSTDGAGLVDQIEAFVDAINEKYWGIEMPLAMSPKNARLFLKGYKAKYGQNTDYKQNDKGVVDFSMVTVKGCPSMIGSNKIFCTPKKNAIRIVKRSANWDKVALEQEDRKVKIWTDMNVGIGFAIPEIVFTNDLELNPVV